MWVGQPFALSIASQDGESGPIAGVLGKPAGQLVPRSIGGSYGSLQVVRRGQVRAAHVADLPAALPVGLEGDADAVGLPGFWKAPDALTGLVGGRRVRGPHRRACTSSAQGRPARRAPG